jgi:uncharacterized protein (TIGR02594 family)
VVFNGWKFVAWLMGVSFTALMVSLGAPFWFGLLGKVANLRMAGRVRRLSEAQVTAATEPLGVTPVIVAPPAAKAATSVLAANDFEYGLRQQDVSRLQKKLGLTPSGILDDTTRTALSAKLEEMGEQPSRELSAITYELLVGRRAGVSGVGSAASAAAGTWMRGQNNPTGLNELLQAIDKLFPAPAWPTLPARQSYDDEVRAMCVLFRVKSQAVANGQLVPLAERNLVKLANTRNGELSLLDAQTRKDMLGAADANVQFKREAQPWLDFALGELGVTEDGSPSQSQPRVIEYFSALGTKPIEGDDTPWCGAFAGWVMARAGLLKKYPGNPEDLIGAIRWKDFGQDIGKLAPPNNNALPGDICVVTKGGQHHVGFWIAQDAGVVWLLGGNQGPTGSGAVTLKAFRLGDGAYEIIAIRR